MKRDPRMVERKKTGLAKARKRVSLFFLSTLLRSLTAFLSTLGSNVDLRLAISIVPLPVAVFVLFK